MDAPTLIAYRIEIWLESIRLMLGDLPEIADEWPQLQSGERASLSLDWDQLMGSSLIELDEYYNSDHMTPEQRARYRDLLGKLHDALPIIERIDFMRPSVSLETLATA